ncbi:DUF2827 domain-containing protein [Paraburkholderia edwinii]|jgi:hypothetical protein|uniref:DUF2827 domain-containing protein n=1 Tax=Paraburkholderia edwinii TaxID=2861782 RepID=A0ABX8UX48_9BURK|nr:DUF2827 family protein [Paraburkholderia edwinii]QYD71922.1 DUF2827 domain-containing protein [Paraburkholderia edwinii]
MRIGISVLTHEGQNIWENGLGQNVFFLAQLLRALPAVTDVILLNCGDQSALPLEAEQAAFGFPLVPMRAATDRIDVAIEMGGGLDVEWVDYLRALGKKVVFICCGQPYVGLIESTVFKKRGFFSRAQRCDEVWILPKDRALAPMLEALHRCPVFEVPYLWDPVFLERRAQVVKEAGLHFGYKPAEHVAEDSTPRALRVAVFEPNISVVKCFAIPALVCDTAFRMEPAAIARLNLLNTVQMSEQMTFTFLVRSLDLHKNEKVHLDSRHDFAGYMSQFADVVVSHQWQNDQNFVYLDALYGGYPLVHNSPWLKDIGYYYEGSDIPAGAKQLLRIAHEHDADHTNYLRRSRDFIATLSSLHAANRECYARRVLQLSAKPARATAFAY